MAEGICLSPCLSNVKKKQMCKTFVISDTWFNRCIGDTSMTTQDINNDMISSWNNIVGDGDDVYVLGGFGISDLYSIIIRLKGRIHFLDNFFNEDERRSIDDMKMNIKKSGDCHLIERIIFEHKQIMSLNKLDVILSYFPLRNWSGKDTGTICFHGIDDIIDVQEHTITSMASYWNFGPACIDDIKDSLIYNKCEEMFGK